MIATPPPTSLEASRKAPLPIRRPFMEFLTIEEGGSVPDLQLWNSRHREQSHTRPGRNTDLFHRVRDHNTQVGVEASLLRVRSFPQLRGAVCCVIPRRPRANAHCSKGN